jgi:SCY1-like protein 2
VWLFEKKFTEGWAKTDRELFMETLKVGVSQLTRLRHPRILTVERALEETRFFVQYSFVFVQIRLDGLSKNSLRI